MADERDTSRRWAFLRDVLIFQGKLVLDGVRDLVLAPISFVAALVDLALGASPPGRRFYALLRAGSRTERWIDLFGAAVPREHARRERASNLDSVVARLEEVVVDQYQRGGITASAKDAIDRWFDALERRTAR